MSKDETTNGEPAPMMQESAARMLVHLTTLDAVELRTLWPEHFSRPPPPRIRRELLARVLAHEIQMRAYGGLSKSAAKALDWIAAREFGEPDDKPPQLTRRRLTPGARLVREWRGITHEVCVTDVGFTWRGTTYRSPSAVARAITGTRWNGPAFFGLRSKAER